MTKAKIKKQAILAPNHVTPTEFAEKKNVSRTVVYSHIKEGKIIADLVGQKQSPMIDWSIYKDYVFATPKWNAESFKEKMKAEAT